MQHPAFPSACQLLISLQHHGILLQRDVGRIFRRCRPIYSFFPLFSLLPLCFVHKQLLAVPHGRDDAQAAAMIIRNRTLHSGQVDAALTNHRKKLADFFHIARIDRIVSRRKSAECRRPYSSKDIGWNVRFPSSASPLLHYLISKTIYKKIGPVFTTRPTCLPVTKKISPFHRIRQAI